ncbi:MAG: ABC transporter permease [Lachnospiraceae bacterium]|nr:ABC transporter permease [Lachnospiraceae bacterium]
MLNIRKEDLQGTGKVYRFTITQMLKAKANIISLIVLFVITSLSLPLRTLLQDFGGKTPFALGSITVVNNTRLAVTEDLLSSVIEGYSVLDRDAFTLASSPDQVDYASLDVLDAVVLLEEKEPSETSGREGSSYVAAIRALPDNTISDFSMSLLKSAMNDLLLQARIQGVSLSEEAYDILSAGVEIEDSSLESYLDDDENSSHFLLQMVYSVIIMMVSTYAISYIIQTIVEEKSSKLVEFLVVSIRPLGLILGKILAALTFVATMFLVMVLGLFCSTVVSGLIGISKMGMANVIALAGISSVSSAGAAAAPASPLVILAFVVSILLGLITFSILAGLSAAGCSSMEDSQSAMGISMLLIMGGYMISIMISAGTGNDAVHTVLSLVPVLSVYCAPVNFLLGRIGFGVLCIAWILQFLVIAFLAVVASRVYEGLLVYRGSHLSFGQILKMAGFGRKTAKNQKGGDLA